MNWGNVGTNFLAILVYAQTVYPGLSGETLLAALTDGTWLPKAINLALMYFLFLARRQPPAHIDVTPPQELPQ
jgi:hypothetical protein